MQLVRQLRRWVGPLAFGLGLVSLPVCGQGTGAWQQLTSPTIRPLARTGHSMATLGGSGLLFGGQTPGAGGSGPVTLNDLWQYNAGAGTFERLNSTTPLITPRSGQAAAAEGIYLYVFFGQGADGTLLNDVWYYDRPLTCWEPRPPAGQTRPAARMQHTAVATPEDQFLVFGGRGGDGSSLLDDLWLYDPGASSWTARAACPGGGRYGHAAVMWNGKMYVFGGTTASGAQNDVLQYDPSQNSWSALTSDGAVPPPFTGAAAAGADLDGTGTPQILLVGGSDGNGADLGAFYAVSVDPVQHVAHWSTLPAHTPLTGAAVTGVARPHTSGTAQDLLLFGGSAGGQTLDQGWIYTTNSTPPPGPDLIPSWIALTQKAHGSGSHRKQSLSGSVAVRNGGTVKSGKCALRLVLTPDGTVHGGDPVLKQLSVAALSPGKSKTLKWSANLAAGQAIAGYHVVAVADALGQVTESNEANNQAVSAALQ